MAEVTPPAAEAQRPAAAVLWISELEEATRLLGVAQERAKKQPGWLSEARVADLHLSRFRLTGDYDDLASAEAAFERAFADAPEGSGPLEARAAFHFLVHRLDAVEPDLAAAEKRMLLDDASRASIALLRAKVRQERGDLEGAGEAMQAILEQRDWFAVRAAVAHQAHLVGDDEAAEASLAKAESMYHGRAAEPRAWMHLQRGLWALDRRALDEALAHYQRADAELSGYWLVEEHMAEVYVERGDLELALPIYESVVERTESPELMSALAGVLEGLGRTDEAARWTDRATAAFEVELARFPETVAGHALDHFLERGDPARAVALAETNAALRPNGPALQQLAEAYRKVGRTADAKKALAKARRTGWAWVD